MSMHKSRDKIVTAFVMLVTEIVRLQLEPHNPYCISLVIYNIKHEHRKRIC